MLFSWKMSFISQELTEYEMERQENIRENMEVMKAAGIKSLSKSLFGSKQSGNTKRTDKRKKKARRGNDEDWMPSDGEGRVGSSDDDESSESQANEVGSAGPGKKKGPTTQLLRKSQRTQVQVQSPIVLAEGMAVVAAQPTQPSTSPTEKTNPFGSSHTVVSSVASSSAMGKKHARGPTRGENMDKIRRTLGHPIPIDINSETMAIEGEYATPVACALGMNIRDHAPIRYDGWGDIDFGIRESIILRVGQVFGLGDYKNDMVVRRVIDLKCQRLYANWKWELYNHYKDLKKKKVSDIKSHALYPCNSHDWIFMIENVWETKDWKDKSERGLKARSSLKFNHTSGSQSFAARASMFVKKHGQKQPFSEHFKVTHIRHKQGNDVWIDD